MNAKPKTRKMQGCKVTPEDVWNLTASDDDALSWVPVEKFTLQVAAIAISEICECCRECGKGEECMLKIAFRKLAASCCMEGLPPQVMEQGETNGN